MFVCISTLVPRIERWKSNNIKAPILFKHIEHVRLWHFRKTKKSDLAPHLNVLSQILFCCFLFELLELQVVSF